MIGALGAIAAGVAAGCSVETVGGTPDTRDESGSGMVEEAGGDSSDSSGSSDGNSDDGDDGGWQPGPCEGVVGFNFLDLCAPADPCSSSGCELCVGGLCVEPAPMLCAGITVGPGSPLEGLSPTQTTPIWVDLDGLPGDELISVAGEVVEVHQAGSVIQSWVLPMGAATSVEPFRQGGDANLDLLVVGTTGQAEYLRVLLGDGLGGFAVGEDPIGVSGQARVLAIDVDNDEDDDLLLVGDDIQLVRNDGIGFSLAASFDLDGRRASVADVDGDGYADDVLVGDYPAPSLLLGKGGTLVLGTPLPGGVRGPNLEFGVGRPLAADVDGDGLVDVVSLIADNFGRVGVRVWPGLGAGQWDEPQDQLLFDDSPLWVDTELLVIADLDGAAPLELLIRRTEHGLVMARFDAGALSLGCWQSLLPSDRVAGLGDLEGDGLLELAQWSEAGATLLVHPLSPG